MTLIDGLFLYSTTALICVQAMYGYTGAQAMGGSYIEMPYLLYLVGSLVPAILLGVFAIAVRSRVD